MSAAGSRLEFVSLSRFLIAGLACAASSATGQADELAFLTASDGALGDGFGASVHVTADTAFVGAPLADLPGFPDCGAVYVYERTGTTWTESAKIVAPLPTEGAHFGSALDFDAGTLLIGAPQHRGLYGQNVGGAPYVFEGEIGALYTFAENAGTWSQTHFIEFGFNGLGLHNSSYGGSVSLSGDRLGVSYTEINQFGWGTNYIRFMDRDAQGDWQSSSHHVVEFNNSLGTPVHLEGELAIVGTRSEMILFDASSGIFVENDRRTLVSPMPVGLELPFRVALLGSEAFGSPKTPAGQLAEPISSFDYSGGIPPQSTPIPVPIVTAQPFPGEADIAVIANELWLGQDLFDASGVIDTGSVLRYQRTNGVWSEIDRLFASDPSTVRGLGHRVHASNSFLIASAPGDIGIEGAALIFSVDEHPAFCFGDGADPGGCNDCPCSNEAPPGTIGGCLNSSSRSARLLALGQASLASDSLRFELLGALENSFGLLLSADLALPQTGPCPVGSGLVGTAAPLGGLRCIGSNLLRHGTRMTDGQGDSTNGWGTPFGPAGGILSQFNAAPGSSRHFQVFYRELPTAGCGTGVNTTNALTVLVRP